jgi:hypothetical protein
MPNGDCPVGAANKADIANHGREIGEMKQALKEHDRLIERNTRCIDKLVWQVSLGAAVGAAVLAPVVSKALALLFP